MDFLKGAISPYLMWIKLGFVAVLCIAIAVLWIQRDHARNQTEKVTNAFRAFESEIKVQAAARIAENNRKDREAAALEVSRQKALEEEKAKYHINTEKLRKEQDHDKAYINNLTAMYRGLRDTRSSAGTAGGLEISAAAELPAESGGDCNAVLIRLTDACRDTTINYNSLYNAWKENCDVYKCK